MIIGKSEKFREFRLRRGFTIDGLSQKAGVSYGTILNIENNKTTTTPTTASKICNALDVDFDEIFKIIKKIQEKELFSEYNTNNERGK